MRIIIGIAAGAIALYVAWNLFRDWYIATHCTMILGTQVCNS